MIQYELTVILRINDELDSNRETVKKILSKHGMEIKSEDEWGRRALAYTIERADDGHYMLFTLEAPPEAAGRVVAEFRLNSDILRFLFVRLDEEEKTA